MPLRERRSPAVKVWGLRSVRLSANNCVLTSIGLVKGTFPVAWLPLNQFITQSERAVDGLTGVINTNAASSVVARRIAYGSKPPLFNSH